MQVISPYWGLESNPTVALTASSPWGSGDFLTLAVHGKFTSCFFFDLFDMSLLSAKDLLWLLIWFQAKVVFLMLSPASLKGGRSRKVMSVSLVGPFWEDSACELTHFRRILVEWQIESQESRIRVIFWRVLEWTYFLCQIWIFVEK